MAENLGESDALEKVQEIPIFRKDVEIPKTTAIAFRNCLRIMIPEPGDPTRFHSLTIADNDRVEFWLEEPNKPIRKGERAEYPGKRTKGLINIGDRLARYVEATPSEQVAIAKQIENEASRILDAEGNRPKNKK